MTGRLARAEGARQQGGDDVQGERARGAADRAGDRFARARRQQDHLRDLVRLPGRDGRRRQEVPGRQVRAGDRATCSSKNLAEYYGAGEDAIYLSGMAAGAATKKGVIGYVVPFAIPEVIRHANAFALGAQADAPGRQDQARLDEVVALARQGEEGCREPAQVGRRRRDRPERRLARRRAVRRERRHPVGRLRLRREVVRAEVVADGGRLPLGLRTTSSGQGRHGRHVEVGLLLGHASRTSSSTSLRSAPASRPRRRPPSPRRRQRSLKGSFYEFQGPIYDQSGKLRVPKGKKLSLDDILAMNWLVKGVVGSPKG